GGKATHYFGHKSPTNGFGLHFNLGYFPMEGNFTMDCNIQNPTYACLNIQYDSISYFNDYSDNTFLTAKPNDGKAQYILDSTWLYKAYEMQEGEDSILIYGIFNEP